MLKIFGNGNVNMDERITSVLENVGSFSPDKQAAREAYERKHGGKKDQKPVNIFGKINNVQRGTGR